VTQVRAIGSQGGVEDQASSGSVIAGKNFCDISTDELSYGSIAPDCTTAETIQSILL
jgi:hypothetical protein